MIIFLLLVNFMTALSAPILEPHNPQKTTHWVSAPETRGTFDILLSCTLTLFLCLWSSLHLNIPHRDDTAKMQNFRKALYTLLALFAPELVVFMAWRQRSSAKALVAEVNTAFEKAGRVDRWETVHGFFVGMGGLVIDLDNSFIPDKRTPFRTTLTPSGVAFLATCGHLPPNVSKEFIEDKSKADDFAKFLVCVQAMWCLLQYIGRIAGHLPVTLLEVNTLGHALCALAIYACWWQKPFDIKHPLPDESVPPNLCAYMWMCSRCEFAFIELSTEGAKIEDQSTNDQPNNAVPSGALPNAHPIEYNPMVEQLNDEPVELREGQCLPGTRFYFNKYRFRIRERTRSMFFWHRYQEKSRSTFVLQREDVRRWRLANEACSQYGEMLERRYGEFLTKRAPNFDSYGLLDGKVTASKFSYGLGFLSAAYGGLHASEWNAFFPTQLECYMWRISAVVVPAAGISAAGFVLVTEHFACIRRLLDTTIGYLLDRPFSVAQSKVLRVLSNIYTMVCRTLGVMLLTFIIVIFILYVSCRLFLVVGAFVSIRKLPLDVYRTPEWSQLLPHL